MAQATYVTALQTIVSRNVPAVEAAVVSVGYVNGGRADAPMRRCAERLCRPSCRSGAPCAASARRPSTENVLTDMAPITGGEDFALMLEATPGALVFPGNGTAPDGTTHNVHIPYYDFNDEAIATGVGFWVSLVRQQLSADAVPGGHRAA